MELLLHKLLISAQAKVNIDSLPKVDASTGKVGSVMTQVFIWAGIIAVLGIVISGLMYVSAFGDQKRVEQGKNGIIMSCIGLGIILMAFAIVRFIVQGVGS